jgi:HPt (histidine-containing phosphotransfer) domain-containing protein
MDELEGKDQFALAVAQLAVHFLQRTRLEAAVLSELIECEQVGDPIVIDKLEHMAHKIHGSGATFGFSALSKSAGEIERLVACLKARDASQETTIGPQVLQRLRECAQRLTQEVEAAAAR